MKEETRDDKDLIYEGIAINQFFFKRFASNYQTTKTWFTKGLRCRFFYFDNFFCFHETTKTWFTKGLRWAVLLMSLAMSAWDDKDLIYEGIAMPVKCLKHVKVIRRQRPDLRRDCDFISLPFLTTVSETTKTWFTKGLRFSANNSLILLGAHKTTKTWFTKGLRFFWFWWFFLFSCRQTTKTWFTKGLRLLRNLIRSFINFIRRQRPDLRRDCDSHCVPS